MPQTRKTSVVFLVTEFEVYKAIMSFPIGLEAGADKIVPKFLKNFLVNQTENKVLDF